MSHNTTGEKITHLVDTIRNHGEKLKTKRVTAGFDGFVDTIVKLIKTKYETGPPVLFGKIGEFGRYILEKEGSSFSLELQELGSKLGGNMPIMANALGRLGINVSCIGALGYPQTHPVFKNLPVSCELHSFADPGTSTAYEFDDGKIMLAHMGTLNTTGWNEIKNIIGIDTLINLYKESDVLSMVNWSEIDASSDIWKGLLEDVLPHYSSPATRQIAFFDLSDCSKRSSASIMEALDLLKAFTRYTKVVLGLNRNEARGIYEVLFEKEAEEDLIDMGKAIFDRLGIDTLLLHYATEAIAFHHDGACNSNSFFISSPAMSTGAGDNFNAGFCAAQLLELDMESSLIFANAVSGFYVKTGTSPRQEDTTGFLEAFKE